jgi:branched-chain amino acid transport system substrate-binding protein
LYQCIVSSDAAIHAITASEIRPDGRAIHPVYLFEAKAPGESKGPWDLYKLTATIPGDQGFRPISEGDCR